MSELSLSKCKLSPFHSLLIRFAAKNTRPAFDVPFRRKKYSRFFIQLVKYPFLQNYFSICPHGATYHFIKELDASAQNIMWEKGEYLKEGRIILVVYSKKKITIAQLGFPLAFFIQTLYTHEYLFLQCQSHLIALYTNGL